jgi:topoisomerase IV subunit A
MAKKIDIPKDNNIIRVPLEEAMPENYLPYAVEVAKDRALPDVRDGLKPVHRRILYGAYMLKAFPDRPYYKSARIVGDILGKYHPHGDSSVYDSMVILAQNFTTRMPLIDGQGNYGSIDGDSAAAMRYTEARLTNISMEMLRDIDKEVVDMIPNYSESELEPKVLPARYPNLLVNGAFGIAVGLATNIPPHNLREVSSALLAFIEHENITTAELMEHVKGPDLPTGGIIIGKNSLLSAYETGEGKVTLRARTSIEKLENGRFGIVITEFPYRRNKAKLLQTISEMTGDKRHAKALEAITDIRDESDRNGIRAVIEFRKSADEAAADKVLKYLFKRTDLQCNLSFNMVALAQGKPETMGLKTILRHYLNHQKEIVTRRTKKELEIAERRFHIVEGFIKAINIMDAIIETIRASKSKKDAQNNLVLKFGFTEIQAEAILELMLYRLTGLEIKTFEKEYKELEKLITKLRKILDNEKELLKVIKSEITEVIEKYGDDRKTEIIEDENEAKIDLEELVVVEDIMVTMSNEGYIKRVPMKSYNRSNTEVEEIEYREGDFNKFLFPSNTTDTLMFFTDKGNMYRLKGSAIPEYRWKEKGEKLDELIRGLDLDQERVVAVHNVTNSAEGKHFHFITSKGVIKKTSLDKFMTNSTKLQSIKLKESERLIDVRLFDKEREKEFIRVETSQGLRFTMEEPPLEAVDRTIQGIQLVKISNKDEILQVDYVKEYEYTEFTVGISSKGVIKLYSRLTNEGSKKAVTSSSQKLLVFTDKGNVHCVDSFMLQELENEEIKLGMLTDFDESSEAVINLISISEFTSDQVILMFTKSGFVKKTLLTEFAGDFVSNTAYKLKSEKDAVVTAILSQEQRGNAIVITRKAMGLKFDIKNLNAMGRIASGVTAITLKEDDEVIFAAIQSENRKDLKGNELAVALVENHFTLVTCKKEKKVISTADIKLQNRAAKGKSVMLVVLDDFIKEVKMS